MPLFDKLPQTLFSPLASPGAPIYAEVLLTLFAESRRHQQPLSRDLTVNLVREVLTQAGNAFDATADAIDESISGDGDDIFSGRAGAIVRYLERCKWLRAETQSDFTQSFTLPDYAFRILNTFHELASDEPLPLQGLIFSIYSLLQTSVREGKAHISLPEAHRQTMSLLSGLKELQHNIGVHIEKVLRQLQARDVLDQLFTSYRGEIVDKAYHQLRTTDHVSRFRPGVLSALGQLSSDEQVNAIAQSLRASGMAPSIEAATMRLLQQTREIREYFEQLDRVLQTIDVRHSQFVDSAVRTVELQLTASTTTSGQLHTLLKELLQDQDGLLADEVATAMQLFALELPDSESLAAPARVAAPFVAQEIAAPQPTPEEIAAAQQRTLTQLQRSISRERVRRFAAELLGDRDEIRGIDIPLDGPETLPLLIYLRSYGNGSLGYQVNDPPDAAWIERDGIGFRDFVLRRA